MVILNRIRILCVHQGAELYGSDRSFLQAVEALREGWPKAQIRIILAADGPLRGKLESFADDVIVRDLAILRLASPILTALKATIALPYYVMRASMDILWADLIYINTTVIADYIIAARIASTKSVVHVREIPKAKAMPIISGLIRISGAGIIFNSHATAAAFSLPTTRQEVVHNGVDAVGDALPPLLPKSFSAERPLRLALLGRISDWKGQDLLIESISCLTLIERANVRVRIVGSAYRDSAEPVATLQASIEGYGLSDVVSLEPFLDDPTDVYEWADICIVPSRLPEPFGRVAIEAMAHGRPVIAAGHGGLTEIVEDGKSGWLFDPNSAIGLASAIRDVLQDPRDCSRRANISLERFRTHFSAEAMSQRLRAIFIDWMPVLGSKDVASTRLSNHS